MYLSKVLISGPVAHNPYEIHRELWTLFEKDAQARRDFLFRIVQSDHSCAEILMQSAKQPEPASRNARIIASKEYSPVFQPEQRLRFLLMANPIKTIDDEEGRKNGKGEIKKCRVPLINEEAQRDWLKKKFSNIALFETIVVEPSIPVRFRKIRESITGKIQPVIYSGVFKVIDSKGLYELLITGIGPAKAFGCGMLSLARV